MNQDCQRNAEKKFSGLKVPETISRETANLFWFPQVIFYDALFYGVNLGNDHKIDCSRESLLLVIYAIVRRTFPETLRRL